MKSHKCTLKKVFFKNRQYAIYDRMRRDKRGRLLNILGKVLGLGVRFQVSDNTIKNSGQKKSHGNETMGFFY